MPDAARTQLELRNVTAGYGPTVVLEQVSLSFAAGETVAILGRNGVGKTTLLETMMGFTTHTGGDLRFEGATINDWPTGRRASMCRWSTRPRRRPSSSAGWPIWSGGRTRV